MADVDKTSGKRVIFLSHSSRDKEIVKAFRNAFLPKPVKRGKLPVDILLTSDDHPDSHSILPPAAEIWKELRLRLDRSDCFIAFLSQDYLASHWCLAELTLYLQLREKESDDKRKLALLVLNEGDKSWAKHFLIREYKTSLITHQAELGQLRVWMNEVLRTMKAPVPRPKKLTPIVSAVKEQIRLRNESEGAHVLGLSLDHFRHVSTSKGPMGALVSRDEYEQIATQMARRTKEKLLWTLYKSPLFVADAYPSNGGADKPAYLMPYDSAWTTFDPLMKVRLVIFEDGRDAELFRTCSTDALEELKKLYPTKPWIASLTKSDLRKRRTDFIRSASGNDGKLYFTTVKRLNDCFPEHNALSKPVLTNESFLEFAYGDCGLESQEFVLMDSGFNSEFAKRTGSRQDHKVNTHFAHVMFYVDPDTDCLRAIEANDAYKAALGHLDHLRRIASAVFSPRPEPKIFVTYANLKSLNERP